MKTGIEGVWNREDFVADYHPEWDYKTSAGFGMTRITLSNGKLLFIADVPSKDFHSNDMLEIIRKLNS